MVPVFVEKTDDLAKRGVKERRMKTWKSWLIFIVVMGVVYSAVQMAGALLEGIVDYRLEEKSKSVSLQPEIKFELQSLQAEVKALQFEVAELKAERAKSAQVPAVPGVLRSEVDYLARDLEQVQAWADREGAYSLYLLDNDLDRVEKGEHPRGSFSDFFILNMGSALSAGVPEAEVEARLERLIALAEGGKSFSTYVSLLLAEGGADAVRAYAKGKTGIGSPPTP